MRTNLYSYGGWALFVSPSYRKRYRFNGNMNLAIQRPRILSDNAKQEFTTAQTFNITWSHTVDPRARPGTSFSANVNAGSTKFNQFVANNPTVNFSNQLSSSITYSKTWTDKFNLTVSANHNQNNNTGIINMNLPNAAFTVNTFYPLQPKEMVGPPKWFHKLGLGLNTNFANQISFYDSLFSFANILDTMQWGAQHNIPIQLSLPPLGPVNIAPGISYQEKWNSRRFERRWDSANQKVDTIISKGLFTSREISFSLGVNTAIFGTFDRFGKNSNIMAIRHVIRPTIGFSFKPDLSSKDFYETYVDSAQDRKVRFSYYDGSIFGGFSEGRFGGISFGIDNVLSMKTRNPKDSTEDGIKRFNIIDGFGFNGGYNFMADSFQLSNFNIYLRSTLFEKINITASGTLDPYQVDASGYRKDVYAWQGGKFSPGRITNGNIAISTSFQSKPKDADKAAGQDQSEEQQYGGPLTPDEQMQQMAYVRQNPGEFADFNVAWSLSLSFSYSFSRQFRSDYKGFNTVSNASFNFNGDFNLTPKWKVGMNGYYDFNTSSLQTFTMFISREMHCWQLSINVTPVGLFRTFNITISPKSGILRDLRINRTRYFYGS